MIEMAFNYAFFSNYNVQGVPSNLLLTAVVVLNAGRNSLSFFMLLIVSLGYGVVKYVKFYLGQLWAKPCGSVLPLELHIFCLGRFMLLV
jgi:hypothetical protein